MTVLAIAVCTVLLLIAALHAYWGLGGLWPAADEATLTATVVGVRGRTRMPSVSACLAVTAIPVASAFLVAFVARLIPSPLPHFLVRLCVGALAAVFLLRGIAAYLPLWRSRFAAEPFATNDRTLYGPLCLGLGAAILLLTV